MSLRHLNFLHWPIRTKLTVIFLLAFLLPIVLVLVPTVDQRINSLRQQNETRLETLGPFEVTRVEQAVQSVVNEFELLITQESNATQIENYLYQAPTGISDSEKERLNRLVDARLISMRSHFPSVSRIRLLDAEGNLLRDSTEQDSVLLQTPANRLLQEPEISFPNAISDVYLDTQSTPSVDVIFPIRPFVSAITGLGQITGYIVFTHNLLPVEGEQVLPDLYAILQDFPQGSQPTHISLLDREGRLISPVEGFDLLTDFSSSAGFQAAQRGETDVSIYHSPLLDTTVMGYHTAVIFQDGLQIVLLIETPLNKIDQQALEESLVVLLAMGLGILGLGLGTIWLATVLIARPIARLTDTVREISAGHLDVQLPEMTRQDEIGVLNNAFSKMADELINAINELEERVAIRTRNLETTLEIGRVLTSIRDLDTLLQQVVNLIRDQFADIYHAQVFLIDPQTNQAKLRASTGAVGRQLLARGHYLDVGSQSVIGSVTSTGHAVVALDTSHNPIHRRNEFLLDTRAEMALPLRIGDRIIGALDLQSKLPDAFAEQHVELFQGMADQITVAIENASLFAESSARLQEIERLNRSLTRVVWEEIEHERTDKDLSAAAGPVALMDGTWTALQLEAMRTRQITNQVDGDLVTFAVPVMVREQVLGAIEWQVPAARYNSDARQTAQELTSRLALTAENIRLFQRSRQATQRELLVNQISSKLIGTTDIDQIMQTAVRELGLALNIPQTAIQLFAPDESPADIADE